MRDISEQPLDPAPRRSRAGLKLAGAAAVVIAVAVAGFGIWQRDRDERKLAAWTDAQTVPTVAIVTPQPETKAQSLTLPGNVDAWYEAPIYARVPGYLQMWYKDIGAKVKTGDLLGVIDTPDLDEQLRQAKADFNSAQANLTLAEVTAKRWQALLSSASVSRQSVDEKVADAAALKAKVAAAQANVDRLDALEGFKRLVAPFDGVVTARKTDIGDLINVGATSGPELFKVADLHAMRVYVRVPQTFSARIAVGMKATLKLPQYPDRTFDASVLTTSNAINPESLTVLVELVAANEDGKLWPGTFADVSFDLPADTKVVQIPASALLFQSEGLQVAVLDPGNKVAIRPVQVGRNFGTMVEVLSGVSATDKVIDSPPDSIVAGEVVRPKAQNPDISRDTGAAAAKPPTVEPNASQKAAAD